ncbi:Hsp20/alpha crystallin family protein [Patescibacteria group bacterium]|nr:Hsp20/alpha crystallin family protein [Patescibacteria group bacterium]
MDLLDKIIKQNQGEGSHFAEQLSQMQEEGELRVDVYQKGDNIIVKSTIAGAKPEDVDININNEILTIRGKRELEEEVCDNEYLHRECYWGSFSRSIILPCEVQKGRVKAIIKRGVLTVVLPKMTKKKEIRVKELGD